MAEESRNLSQGERLALEILAANDAGSVGQRARAILSWSGLPDPDRAALASGLRPAQVRHWVRAFERSGLQLFRPAATATPSGEAGAPSAPPAASEASPGRRRPRGPRLRAGDPFAEALRRLLVYQFAKLRRLQAAAFAADEEAIHDMRVAIRRVRAALRIGRPFCRRKRLEAFRTRLAETADALGAVRDLDVILAHADSYAGGRPEGGGELAGWLDLLRGRRREALEALREHLSGKRFRRLQGEFRQFLAEAIPGARRPEGAPPAAPAESLPGAAGPVRIRDVLPAALWAQYGLVRAHEGILEPTPESLHTLRIEIKRLRYLLEFFQGVLGSRVAPAIETAVRAQDHLGRLHDAWVAAGLLRQYIGTSEAAGAIALVGAAAYLAELTREMESLAETFREVWLELTAPPYRRRLARLIARI
jgi:CHAD domain-containing protein